jgi:hypothetical protein
VAVAIGNVVELVGPNRALGFFGGDLGGERLGVAHVVAGVGVGHGRHQPQVGAAEPQHVLLLLTLRLRHDDDGTVAAGVGDQCNADAGVAGSALDDHAAGPQLSLLLGVLDDGECGAVLDRTAGVEELRLAVDLAARRLRRSTELDQRRVADAIDET